MASPSFTSIPFPKLMADTYTQWSELMETFLGGQDVWDAIEIGVDTLLTRATTEKAQREVRVKDKKALSYIQNGVDKENFERIMDSAYAEVLSTGDDFLLVKLMDRSGPVLDHLSDEIAVEILNAVLQLVLEQNLFDICLSWVQQLAEVVLDNDVEVFGIPMDIKRELLFNLHEASATVELPKDWEGATPEQLMLQLASSWGINLQHHTGE